VRRGAAVGSMLAAVVLLSACSTLFGTKPSDSGGQGAPPSTQRCASLLTAPTDTAKVASVTVLLADGSASAFTRRDGRKDRQDWAAILGQELPDNGNDLLAMGLFGGSVDWKFTKVTAGKSTDSGRTANDMKDTRSCLVGDLSSAMSSAPTKPQTDVLRALAEGAEYVRDRPGPKSIYLATDGLSNTGCADLRAAPIGDLSAIPGMVQACSPELPTLDKDYSVHFVGIGNPADGWPDVKTPQRIWMQKLWQALCVATDATCDDPSSAAPGSVPAANVTLLPDVDVAMPAVTTKPGNPAVITVPASILFDVDKYVLASGRSQDALQQVMDFLKQVHYTRVVIDGHTDSTGTPEHNRALSLERADAVANFLRSQNIGDITTAGYGSTQPACTPEYNNGKPNSVNMACNRRVEILIYTN
jgi:OOP family OmpA-OmpF porin